MNVCADTNILVRVLTDDDQAQNRVANALLDAADRVVFTLPMLCELVWVLSHGYRSNPADIADALRGLLSATNVQVDRSAVDAGLAILDAGGDFADGVIAYEGRRMGGDTFVSFDRAAVRLLEDRGHSVHLLSA